MSSVTKTLIDAVAAQITAASLPESVTAVAAWRPEYDITEVSGTVVVVSPAPSGTTLAREDRTRLQRNVDIYIAFVKKLSATAATRDAEIDAAIALCEAIASELAFNRPGTYDSAMPMTVEHNTLWDKDAERGTSLCKGELTATYRIVG